MFFWKFHNFACSSRTTNCKICSMQNLYYGFSSITFAFSSWRFQSDFKRLFFLTCHIVCIVSDKGISQTFVFFFSTTDANFKTLKTLLVQFRFVNGCFLSQTAWAFFFNTLWSLLIQQTETIEHSGSVCASYKGWLCRYLCIWSFVNKTCSAGDWTTESCHWNFVPTKGCVTVCSRKDSHLTPNHKTKAEKRILPLQL